MHMDPEQMRAICGAIADAMVATAPISGVLATMGLVGIVMLVVGYSRQHRPGRPTGGDA